MTVRPSDPLLAVARVLILIGQGIMGIAAAALVVGIPLLVVLQDRVTAEMREETGRTDIAFPLLPVLGVMAIGLAVVVLAFFFLRHMRRIVDTVGEGDPFVPENADRLTAMAWLMLGIQLLVIPAAALTIYIQRVFEEVNASIDTDVDFSGILLVIVLFILARVFRHGTSLRADLEGTV
ncbi:DUF2975 domain-containing protein [Qipengyuania atrilutea]|uniref:DUF2975 domain-containing protein n=1 Tax=Qipengyuania atrilutea TaxID=2744473 RepID=A0A850H055_9SPHN|nr:DUF2975 domain-containing protein [Actirhodobacter atriluteus]NVD45261.1 DUF2975 domain-containing protein [Actirhodobacter atriluteus]